MDTRFHRNDLMYAVSVFRLETEERVRLSRRVPVERFDFETKVDSIATFDDLVIRGVRND